MTWRSMRYIEEKRRISLRHCAADFMQLDYRNKADMGVVLDYTELKFWL